MSKLLSILIISSFTAISLVFLNKQEIPIAAGLLSPRDGGSILEPGIWYLDDTAIQPADVSFDLGSSGIPVANGYFTNLYGSGISLTGLTASQLVATDISKNLVSLTIATYPSLNEISYVKGLTSAIQTQLDGKANTALSNLASVAINTALLLGTSDGAALGSSTKMWSDLFLASGGIINWNNGNATITHSIGLLTSNVDIAVPDEVYGAGWNGSLEVPTKNAVYDKIETIGGGHNAVTLDVNADTLLSLST